MDFHFTLLTPHTKTGRGNVAVELNVMIFQSHLLIFGIKADHCAVALTVITG